MRRASSPSATKLARSDGSGDQRGAVEAALGEDRVADLEFTEDHEFISVSPLESVGAERGLSRARNPSAGALTGLVGP